MKEKVLITSALPYANGPLHFGHIAGAYLPADCYARFERLSGKNVLYVCGSDEYGVAITMSSDLAKRTPQEHVNIFHEVNKELFSTLNISFDHYSRTTWEGHAAPVQNYFKDLLANGYIEERVTDQLYSEDDQKFLADRYVVGECPKCGFMNARGDECPQCGAGYEAIDLKNPKSKLSGAKLVLKPTKHWFLLLDKFKDQLLAWLETKNWKNNVVNFVKGYIQDLRPRAITRDSTWGIPIPLPDTEGKVLYVWFDAPIGYISATMEWSKERWKEYWCDPKTKLVHFIGKDNIPFHAAIFPAMTMGQNQPFKLVDELPANEFYNLEGRQFSKSDGWTIELEDFFKRYTTDQIRYVIASNAPETSDSEFTWKDFQLKCNTDLLGKYGNLVNRILVFAKNQCEGKVPACHLLNEMDREFLENIRNLANEAAASYAHFKVRRASQIIMELAHLGNVYFDHKKPWKPASKEEMETTIFCCLQCLKVLALISYPIIPETANKVWKLLNLEGDLSLQQWNTVLNSPIIPEHPLREPKILFQRIEDVQIQEEINKLKIMFQQKKEQTSMKNTPMEYAPMKELIDIDQFRKLDLRVGVVLHAEAVPKSKKLLKLNVDLGFEKRTIVSGISQFYQPDQLIGQEVIVVANLKPATLMGIESQGMILAGKLADQLKLASLSTIAAGAIVE